MKLRRSFSVENNDEKNGRRENIFQNKCALVPREEGATVAATPYLLRCDTVRAGLVRAERAAILHRDLYTLQESPIKYRKCPTFDTKRDFQNSLIGPPKQMKQMKQRDAAESDRKIRLIT